jgi:excisionase family DNA binding protein
MLISTPEDRTQLWAYIADCRDSDDRESRLEALGKSALEDLRSQFDLYSNYEDPFIETMKLLDRAGELLDRQMLSYYLRIGRGSEDAGRDFFRGVLNRLVRVVETGTDQLSRTQAADLYVLWRDHVGSLGAKDVMWTVSDVAKKYGVVPQTVYKWIDNGKVHAHRSPGGGCIRIDPRDLEDEGSSSRLARAAVKEFDEMSVVARGRPRKINEDVAPAYEAALAALDEGTLPSLPRRRYDPERVQLAEAMMRPAPSSGHVHEFAEPGSGASRRRGPYKSRTDR